MHVGTIRIKDNLIYIDIINNKMSCYQIKKGQKQTIDENIIINIIKNIITCHKPKLLYKDNYEVYLDEETNFKHFYKNNKEDYLKFFLENGQEAILFNEKGNNKYTVKRFIIKGIEIYCLSMLFITVASVGLTLYKINETSTATETLTNNTTYSTPEEYLNASFFKDWINNSTNLTQNEKQILINEKLFSDLSQTLITSDRVFSLELKLNNINVAYGKDDIPSNNILGWYNPLIPNKINVVNEGDIPTTIHEFIHLLQDDNKYSYIREASATLISNEYYYVNLEAYSDAITRIKLLMELIGPETIWNLNFSGSVQEFENTIKQILPENEANELLELFTANPGLLTPAKRDEINKKIDTYLNKMYTILNPESKETLDFLSKNAKTYYLYSNENIFNHNYFNIKNKENNIDSFQFQYYIPLDTAINQNMVDISYILTQKIYVDSASNNKDIIYKEYFVLNKNISELVVDQNGNQYFVDLKTGENYTPDEAQKLGYIETKYFKYKFYYNIKYQDVEKYQDIPNIIINTPEIIIKNPYNENISQAYTNDTYPINNIIMTYQLNNLSFQNENSKTK